MFVIVLPIDIQYLKILGRDKKIMACGKCMNIVPHAITINQTSIVMRNIYGKIQLMLFLYFSVSQSNGQKGMSAIVNAFGT